MCLMQKNGNYHEEHPDVRLYIRSSFLLGSSTPPSISVLANPGVEVAKPSCLALRIPYIHGVSRLASSFCCRHAWSRRRQRLNLEQWPCHVLWRHRRLWDNGRSVWVRQHVQRRVRDEHGSTEHSVVQQRAKLRCMLRDPLCRWGQLPIGLRGRNGHQPLPAQLRAPQQ